jgi:tetratricopeptide (TPR) repeat protein
MRLLFFIIYLFIVESVYSQNDSHRLFLQAEKAENSGQNTTAIDLYSRVLKQDSLNAKAYLGRAKSYYWVWSLRDKNDSLLFNNFLFDLNKSFQLDSTNNLCNFWLAEKTGLTNKQALDFYNRAIRYCTDNEAYFSHRAICLMHLGQFELAIEDINRANKLSNKRTDLVMKISLKEDYLGYRAICYAKLNNLISAERDLDKAIESCNTKHELYLYLGTVKALEGEYNQALEIFNGIIKKSPYVAVTYLFIGNVYNRINEPKLAENYWLTALDKGIQLNNRNKDINYQLDYFIEKFKFGF